MATSLPPVPLEASPGERAFLEALRRMVLEQGKRIDALQANGDKSGGSAPITNAAMRKRG